MQCDIEECKLSNRVIYQYKIIVSEIESLEICEKGSLKKPYICNFTGLQ